MSTSWKLNTSHSTYLKKQVHPVILKYVKIRDLDCKKNIHLEHQFQVFVIEQLYVCPSCFKKTNICRSTYIKGCYHAPIPIMKIFIIWLKQLATDVAVQVFKISKWRFLVHFLSIYIWDAAIFMTIYSDFNSRLFWALVY